LAAYKIQGLTQPSEGDERVVVEYKELNARALVVYDIDSYLLDGDRQSAVGSLILKGLVGQSDEGSLEARIAGEVEKLRRVRGEAIGPGLFLIFEAIGDIEPFEVGTQKELPDFIVALNGTPKQRIRSGYAATVNGLLASFALASETVHGFTRVSDEILFRADDDRPIYAYTLTGSASVSVSTTLKPELLDFVSQSAKVLAHHQGLIDPARLVVRSYRDDGDDLLAFLSAWAGLEIFVNKNFREYEDGAFKRLTGPEKFIGRIREVMKDKYGPADKFSLIAFELTTGAGATEDERTFKEIKNIRDKLMHGEEVPTATLPTEQTQKLLRKYLKLHLERLGA
jgi:hypothetical protein